MTTQNSSSIAQKDRYMFRFPYCHRRPKPIYEKEKLGIKEQNILNIKECRKSPYMIRQ